MKASQEDHGGRPDVVVIGAGVVGLCTALELAQAGMSVVVISGGKPHTGASAGNAGMVVPSHVVPLSAPGVIAQGLRWLLRRDAPFHLKPRPSPALLRWLLLFRAHCTEAHVKRAVPILRDLSMASVEGFEKLAEQGDDFAWSQTGLLMVYRSQRLGDSVMHEGRVAADAGLRVRELDRDALREFEPGLLSPASGAVLYEDDGRVDPDRLLRTLEDRVRAAGGTIRHELPVRHLEPGRVVTGRGELQADHVVVAAGAWSPELVRGLPVQPAKGYSVTVDPPPGGPRTPMILMEDRVTVTPMPGRIRFGGTLSLAGYDATVDRRRIRPILEEAVRYRPEVDPESLQVWSGFRPASPDGLPFIGPHTRGVWLNTGHGMMGVSLAPASGRLLADQILGRTPSVDPAPYAPDRLGRLK